MKMSVTFDLPAYEKIGKGKQLGRHRLNATNLSYCKTSTNLYVMVGVVVNFTTFSDFVFSINL